MPDWTALRQRACAMHLQLRARIEGDGVLVPAEALLKAAEAETGMKRQKLPMDDPLLSGAYALLDREAKRIRYAVDGPLSPGQVRLILAHEFAHFWLHPDMTTDSIEGDVVQEMLATEGFPLATDQVAEGYSPAERRETEANLFAAELLLPGPLLRRIVVEQGASASWIAAQVGVPETAVRTQLANALLLPVRDLPAEDLSGSPMGGGGLALDASQRQAAEVETGPVLVDAGPGTGKTCTLIARILHLLEARQVAPENILALTFSNKAAEEMRTRLRSAVGDLADRLWIGTFHAFGNELLRKDGNRIGLPSRPTLLDLAGAVALLEQNLHRLDLREYEYLHQPSLPFPDILRCISRAKDELITPVHYRDIAERQAASAQDEAQALAARKSQEIAGIYAVYQEVLAERGAVDFGDLLMRAVELLYAFPDVCARWQAQFPQILADEYQDINRASARLLQRLAGDGTGFWAVGDLRQAIYRFRGASPANVREFERDFPGGRRLRLAVNYRSRPPLVALFSRVAADMERGGEGERAEDKPFAWEAMRADAEAAALICAVAENEEAQAEGIAAQIRQWEAVGIPKQEQAILCTTNAQAADLSARLSEHGIATQHLGGLFDRPEVKDLLALVALACEPEGTTLPRVAQFPEYAIPPEDVERLLHSARQDKQSFPGALAFAVHLPDLTEAGRAGFARLWQHLEPCIHRGDAWAFLTRYLFEMGGYLRPLLAEPGVENQQKLLAIERLLAYAQGLSRRLPPDTPPTQAAFLNHLRHLMLCGEAKSVRLPADLPGMEGVRLMTAHQSKGLEFPVVYLPNLIEGQFPMKKGSSMATPPQELLEEPGGDEATGEDCLFFVALSRARDHLVLSSPGQWRGRAAKPSRFLEAIRADLDACRAERVAWTRSVSPPVEEAPQMAPAEESDAPRPALSLPAVDEYRDCPRRYYYRHVARLPEPKRESAYMAYHRSLEETIEWMRSQEDAEETQTFETIKAQFDARWSRHAAAFEGQEWTSRYRERAYSLLAGAALQPRPQSKPLPAYKLIAHLAHGSITMRPDYVEEREDGTLHLQRRHKRPAKKTDHTEEELALLRVAAQQHAPDRKVEIALHYLTDGETRPVPENRRYEPARVEKFDRALEGIQRGDFPAEPSEQKCAHCPYF